MEKIYIATEQQLKCFLEELFKSMLKDQEQNRSTSELGEYIEEKEAIQLLGRKTTWFYNMRQTGKLPFTKIGSKTYYSKADLIQILDKNKNKG